MTDERESRVLLMGGDGVAAYGFGDGHPFGPDRFDAFVAGLDRSPVRPDQVFWRTAPAATVAELEYFHRDVYVDFVQRRCREGRGFLDGGDTPALAGLFESSSSVVGAALSAARALMAGEFRFAFQPIGGLHHAARDAAAGFCVFNDCGIVAEMLRAEYGLTRIAYIDIDAHHGDGVYYGFESDPWLIFADLHEDGRFLYPGTGRAEETGKGAARGTKLNMPLPPGTGDAEFMAAWARAEAFIEAGAPEFVILQCGADSVAGDPITHMACSAQVHGLIAGRITALADRAGNVPVLALGGGGYNRDNLAAAWSGVVESLTGRGVSA